MYLAAILTLFFVGGVAALAVRTELYSPNREVTREITRDDGSKETVTEITGQLFNAGTVISKPVIDSEGRALATDGKPLEEEIVGPDGTVTRRTRPDAKPLVEKERVYTLASGNQTYNRLMTLHGAIMVFMVIVPSIPASLGNFFLPIMIGAKDVAFPRLNLLSWWIYVAGSIFAVVSVIAGGVDTGWTFYTPYSTMTDADHWRVVFMIAGAFILGFSSILTGLNFIVTVHKLRAPGMGWFDMPLFVWALYATAIIQVLATPVIGITLLLLIFERLFHVGIFDPRMGGDPVLFQHFFWFYSHPVVYVMIIPGMGIASELIGVHAHKKLFGYRSMAYAVLGIAAVSFIVWGHHMFTAQGELAAAVFSAVTFLVAIPTAVKMFNWIGTLYKGSIQLNTPMLYALSFLFLFAIGGLTGLPLATLSTDMHLHDSYFVVAHFHYVMMGGTIIAFIGGIHHWWPKMFGRMYNEKVGILGCLLVFVGFNVTFFTQFFLGTRGMPRRYASYVDEFQLLHQISTIGSYILAIGMLVHLLNFVYSLFNGPKAPPNPWGGLTLEWTTESPPIEHNFHHEPLVTHGPYDFDDVVPPHRSPEEFPLPEKPADAH
ncbi:MAG: cbb3-type cytochrome c oxidase subunit I [Phycisphaeraceae bacterium]|nr:cbb3-type cytochrome c oxidase subunit I [Phycisphaeraceae bacterium]